jgi:hypothetical protein
VIDIRITGDDAERFLRALEVEITPALARAVLRSAQDAAGELALASMEALTKRPTGSLARSFEVEMVSGSGGLSAGAFSRLPYAAIHDSGGTIRAKRRKYLAIPLDGIPRGMGPRQYPTPLEFRPSRSGNGGVLVDASGKPRYALKRSVRMRATGYVGVALKRLEGTLQETADGELITATAVATGKARRG